MEKNEQVIDDLISYQTKLRMDLDAKGVSMEEWDRRWKQLPSIRFEKNDYYKLYKNKCDVVYELCMLKVK